MTIATIQVATISSTFFSDLQVIKFDNIPPALMKHLPLSQANNNNNFVIFQKIM